MIEFWKDIEGYNGYQVSNFGRIRTYNKVTYTEWHGIRHWKDRILKQRIDKRNKMLSVMLFKNGKGKSYLVHRLVAETFLGNPKNKKMTVNHKDGNRYNNNVENLEWMTLKDNINHGFNNNLYSSNKFIKIVNKENNMEKIFRSMAMASNYIQKGKGYISYNIKKGIYENDKYSWSTL